MRHFKNLIILIKTLCCILPKEIISEENEKIFKDEKLHSSILNPFFGHIFYFDMLHNLRFYYYGITLECNYKGERFYVEDRGKDGLSTILIELFPSPSKNLSTITPSSSNLIASKFGDIELRTHCIKIFAKFFVDILNRNSRPIKYDNLEDDFSVKEKLKPLILNLRRLSNKILTPDITNEEHCLVNYTFIYD